MGGLRKFATDRRTLWFATSALALAGTKITTYAQTAQPPVNTSKSGDLWIDTDDGNRLYRFNGTSWTDVRDSTIVSAQQTASQALTAAGQKGKTYSQGSAPNGSSTPPPITGDLWWDTTNYVLKQYNGSTWNAPAMDASQNIRSNTITAARPPSAPKANTTSEADKAVAASIAAPWPKAPSSAEAS